MHDEETDSSLRNMLRTLKITHILSTTGTASCIAEDRIGAVTAPHIFNYLHICLHLREGLMKKPDGPFFLTSGSIPVSNNLRPLGAMKLTYLTTQTECCRLVVRHPKCLTLTKPSYQLKIYLHVEEYQQLSVGLWVSRNSIPSAFISKWISAS